MELYALTGGHLTRSFWKSDIKMSQAKFSESRLQSADPWFKRAGSFGQCSVLLFNIGIGFLVVSVIKQNIKFFGSERSLNANLFL